MTKVLDELFEVTKALRVMAETDEERRRMDATLARIIVARIEVGMTDKKTRGARLRLLGPDDA